MAVDKIFILSDKYFNVARLEESVDNVVEAWNKKVNEYDRVYILSNYGSFMEPANGDTLDMIGRLNGEKYIIGRHKTVSQEYKSKVHLVKSNMGFYNEDGLRVMMSFSPVTFHANGGSGDILYYTDNQLFIHDMEKYYCGDTRCYNLDNSITTLLPRQHYEIVRDEVEYNNRVSRILSSHI